MLKSGYLPGVLRLAHSLDWSMLDLLTAFVAKAVESEIPADKYDIVQVSAAASDLKLEDLRLACYSAVSKLCISKSPGFAGVKLRSAVEVVDALGDSPQLLKAALLVMLSRKDISARELQRILDRKMELPSALFTWRCSMESLEGENYLNSDWFTWNGEELKMQLHRNTQNESTSYGLYLAPQNLPAQAGQEIEYTLRVAHWLGPEASIERKISCSFSLDTVPAFGFASFIEKDALRNFTDADGLLTFQVGHMKLV